ncbi:uncharacterized protein PSANT_06959 [Moesziomyces antarcticus]|uniref:Uncharacterized protein n=1 Tax=Pseudozyma antarctica TaxID=84753 RepID=A0A5C3FY45_PSEA2|nr:uncharacterized protein PSANT_06959 [Moesziomyces antarcticus]
MLDEASGVPANDASTDGIGTACTCSGSHFPARRGVHARYGCRCNTTANDGARIGIVCLASHQLPNVAPESSQTGAFPLQATARFHSSEPHPDLSFGSPSRFSFLFFSFSISFSKEIGSVQFDLATKISTHHRQDTVHHQALEPLKPATEGYSAGRLADWGGEIRVLFVFGIVLGAGAGAATHQWLSEADGKRAHDQSPPWHRTAPCSPAVSHILGRKIVFCRAKPAWSKFGPAAMPISITLSPALQDVLGSES